jgi:MFS family permease
MSCPTDAPARPEAATPARPARVLSHRAAFVGTALVLVLFLAASAAPSPLYVVYQAAWHFTPSVLTLVFAVYVAGLLGSLLVIGALSDHVGRRPVLGAAVALEAVSLVLFLVAGDVTGLVVARLVQGVATGAAMTTLGAMLVDLAPPHAPGRAGVVSSVAPVAGLAAGAVACGALVQLAPAPTHLVYALLLGGVLLAGVLVAVVPETSTRRPGALGSLRPRVRVAAHLRADFLALAPVMIASWAVGGLYLSLGPSVAGSLLGLRSHLVGGLVVAALCGTGALTSLALRTASPVLLVRVATVLMALGMLVSLAGVETSSALLALVGTLVSGVGFGAAGLAVFGRLARIAGPDDRGELFAAAFVVSYLAFSVPAVVAGVLTTRVGLQPTVVGYGVAVTLLSLLALLLQRLLVTSTES